LIDGRAELVAVEASVPGERVRRCLKLSLLWQKEDEGACFSAIVCRKVESECCADVRPEDAVVRRLSLLGMKIEFDYLKAG